MKSPYSPLLLCLVLLSSCYCCLSRASDDELVLSKELVDAVNNNAKAEWTAGVNEKFSSMTIKQARRFLALRKSNEVIPLVNHSSALGAAPPSQFFASQKWPKCVGPILNQGDCGSCWAFAGAEAMSDRHCIYSGSFTQFSPLDITSCDNLNSGCDGGTLYGSWKYVKYDGIVTEACSPYLKQNGGPVPSCQTSDEPCDNSFNTPNCPKYCKNGVPWKKAKYMLVKSVYGVQGELDFQKELYAYGPFSVGFDVYTDFLHYKSGIYSHLNGSYIGSHAAKVVGWGIRNGTKYWKVANSWSTAWGNGGYFYIRRGVDESVGADHTFNHTLDLGVLRHNELAGLASFTVTSCVSRPTASFLLPQFTAEIEVCLKQGDIAPPVDVTGYWKNVCQFVTTVDNAEIDFELPMLTPGKYFLAASVLKGAQNVTSKLFVTYNGCSDASKHGPDCTIVAQPLMNATVSVNATNDPKSSTPLYVAHAKSAGEGYGLASLKVSVRNSHMSKGSALVNIMQGNAPVPINATFTAKNAQLKVGVDKHSSHTIVVPQPDSQWFIAVGCDAAKCDVELSVDAVDCTEKGTGGADCGKIAEIPALGKAQTFTASSSWTIYAMDSDSDVLAVAAAASDGSSVPPVLAARYGAVPDGSTFDEYQCSRGSCDVVALLTYKSSSLKQGSNAAWDRWFVALKSSNKETDMSAALWNAENDTCAGDCSSHGTCDKTTLQCTCTDTKYEGVACATVAPLLKPWEWALIIGGGVLLAIGCIGVLVYIVQRNQAKAGYEKV